MVAPYIKSIAVNPARSYITLVFKQFGVAAPNIWAFSCFTLFPYNPIICYELAKKDYINYLILLLIREIIKYN